MSVHNGPRISAGQTGIDLVSLDHERLIRTLTKAGVDPRVVDIFAEMHDTTVAMQKAVNEILSQQGKVIEALTVINKGFGVYSKKLAAIEKKYGDPHKDLVSHQTENSDGS